MRPSACVSTTLIKREWSQSGRKSGTKHFIESLRLISCRIRQLLIRISQLFINLSLGEMCECLYIFCGECVRSAPAGSPGSGWRFLRVPPTYELLVYNARARGNQFTPRNWNGKNLMALSGNFPRLPPPCALFLSKLRSLSPHHLHVSQTSKTVCVKISKNER